MGLIKWSYKEDELMFDKDYILKVATKLLEIPSPTGYCFKAIKEVERLALELGYQTIISQKGNLTIHLSGKDQSKTVGLTAHIDTLGLMVRSIKDNGYLAVSKIGGPLLSTYDGEYCQVITRQDKTYSGTILSKTPSVHVYPDSQKNLASEDNLEVRLDEVVKNKADVLALGINHGDIIALDPKTMISESGYIKSRFLDDKISVALIFGLLKYLKDKNLTTKFQTKIIISTYEEVGHGGSSIDQGISELIAIDMGCIGLDLAGNEESVSICVKDSSGPYDYHLTTELINYAKQSDLSYAVDIYPFYGSDVSAALRAGHDLKGALIGPGVHASHGMERTHYQALHNTMALLLKYLT